MTPLLAPPRLGDPVSFDPDELAYIERVSAERQALAWNVILETDPVYGPLSGYRVGVAPFRVNRRFRLVWVAV